MAIIANLKGVQGVPGTNGTDGTNGTNGTNGTDGTVWHHGTGAPSVQTGTKLAELTAAKTGDYYLNDATSDYYIKAQAAGTVWAD